MQSPVYAYSARPAWQWIFEEALGSSGRRVNNSSDLPSSAKLTQQGNAKLTQQGKRKKRPLRRPPAGFRVETLQGDAGGWYSSPCMSRLGDKSDLVFALQEVGASWAAPSSLVLDWNFTTEGKFSKNAIKQRQYVQKKWSEMRRQNPSDQYSSLEKVGDEVGEVVEEEEEEEEELGSQLFLLKPSSACGGSGIVFCRTISQALKILDHDAKAAVNELNFLEYIMDVFGKMPRWIMQEHVESALIRGGKKFHVRSYLVYDERTKKLFLRHSDHEVRIAKESYNEAMGMVYDDRYEHGVNPDIHITNGGGSGLTEVRVMMSEVEELCNQMTSLNNFLKTLFGQLLPIMEKEAMKYQMEDQTNDRIEHTPVQIRRMAMCACDVMLEKGGSGRWCLLEVNTTAPGAPPSEAVPVGTPFRAHLKALAHDLTWLAMGQSDAASIQKDWVVVQAVQQEKAAAAVGEESKEE